MPRAPRSAAPQHGKFTVIFAPPRVNDERILVSLLKQAQMPKVFALLSQHLKLTLNHPFSALALECWFNKYPKAKPDEYQKLRQSWFGPLKPHLR